MITPASYDFPILQNSTYRGVFRVTQEAKPVTIDVATSTFIVECGHGYTAGDRVVISPATTTSSLPCGINSTTLYYVIATGLTTTAFKLSATSGGASLTLTLDDMGSFFVSKPVNLTGYTVDADIKGLADGAAIGTFTPTITSATTGEFELAMLPATTLAIAAGRYGYDISLTSGGGERYYWLTGVVTVTATYSRS